MKKLIFSLLAFFAFLTISSSVLAQAKQRVAFPKGRTNTTLRGTVRGYAYVDYIVKANAEQTISVELDAPKIVPVFSILRPDGETLGAAVQTNDFTGELPTDGDYIIRVGMMRAFARRKGSVSNYTLKISIRGKRIYFPQ